MRVVAINGSPRGTASNTAVMIEALLDGFASNGDLVKSIVLSEKSIQYCSGCYTCWSKTPGVCIHKDDMKDIIQQLRDTSVVVIGTPLYFNNISGTLNRMLKNVIFH
jgi:multimeric flavodoxin WrbA